MLSCSAGLSSTTSSRLRRGLAYSLIRVIAASTPSVVVGLVTNENAPRRKRMLAVFVQRDDLHRDVAGQRILLELVQYRPAEHVGQEDVERHRRRLELLGKVERIDPAHGDQDLEAVIAREVHDHARIVRIVLDDQQDAVARRDGETIVRNVFDAHAPPAAQTRCSFRPAPGHPARRARASDGPTYLSGT